MLKNKWVWPWQAGALQKKVEDLQCEVEQIENCLVRAGVCGLVSVADYRPGGRITCNHVWSSSGILDLKKIDKQVKAMYLLSHSHGEIIQIKKEKTGNANTK